MQTKVFIRVFCFALIALVSLPSMNVCADMVVIVHPSNASKISKSEIKQIYLAKRRTYHGGIKAYPVDQAEGSLIRELFNKNVLSKNSKQLKSYWAKLLFTGQASPPEVQAGDENVKKKVASDPGGIGYIDSASVDDTVKVVFKL